MTAMQVNIVGDIPLVTIEGDITTTSGAQLAQEIMSMIHHGSMDNGRDLSLPAPRLLRG